jgi:hypothetical protein
MVNSFFHFSYVGLDVSQCSNSMDNIRDKENTKKTGFLSPVLSSI